MESLMVTDGLTRPQGMTIKVFPVISVDQHRRTSVPPSHVNQVFTYLRVLSPGRSPPCPNAVKISPPRLNSKMNYRMKRMNPIVNLDTFPSAQAAGA